MISLAQYRKRFVFISTLISFCACGTFLATLVILETYLDSFNYGPNQFIAVTLITGCFFLGLISPQWLIKKLLGWKNHKKQTADWLPAVAQANPVAMGVALSAFILIYAILAIISSLILPWLSEFHNWFSTKFFMASNIEAIFSIILLLLILGPMWFVFGITIDLLYRIALSFTTLSGPCRNFERNTPIVILLGLSIGILFWQFLLEWTGPLIAIWLAQFIAVGCVMTLLFLPLRIAWQTKRSQIDDSTVILEQARPALLPRIFGVWLCGLLIGFIFKTFRSPALAAEHKLLTIGYDSIVLLALTLGMYIILRLKDNNIRKPGWVYSGIFFVAAGILCIKYWPGFYIGQNNAIGATAVAAIMMTMTGSIAGYSKYMVQEVSVSRCLGWGRWLILLATGIFISQIIMVVALK